MASPQLDGKSIVDFLPDHQTPAIYAASVRDYITHAQLKQFVQSFRLPSTQSSKKEVVAVALPNGPILAATILAVSTYYTAAPVTPGVGVEQFKADVLQAGATIILTTSEDHQKLALRESWVSEAGIQVCLARIDSDMSITVTSESGSSLAALAAPQPSTPKDTCIQLFTSGTSGNKKLVPISIGAAISGAHQVISSWGLTPQETCLNMMPLHHVGGLIRNVFAPIFAGGSTICCSGFDPGLFWDLVDESLPTWYYASPTMHSLILNEGINRQADMSKSKIRLICNAAGGLLPALAEQLRDTFNCTVLPSYGMTECMPISTPPLDYKLDREGTSGISVGPDLTILDGAERQAPPHTIGRISVRGSPVFEGYLRPDGTLDKSAFNADGWFDTGDLGYMDEDGFLYITGRSKEVINRGGEIISPFEVENAIVSAAADPDSPIFERVSQALAFGLAHDVLQEVVGIVLVTPKGKPRVDIRVLHVAMRSLLQQAKWPTMIVYMDDVPKRNNKVLRTNLAKRLSLPEQTATTSFMEKHWDAVCPPVDTPLQESIPAHICTVEPAQLQDVASQIMPTIIEAFVDVTSDGSVEMFLAPRPSTEVTKEYGLAAVADLKKLLPARTDNYNIPERIQYLEQPIPFCGCGTVDKKGLHAIAEQQIKDAESAGADNLDEAVVHIMAKVLNRSPTDIEVTADFFSIGGDSITAGRLLSLLRGEFKVSVPIEFVFNHGSAREIAKYLEQEGASLSGSDDSSDDEKNFHFCEKQYSATNLPLMLLQLIPMTLLYPMRRALQWTIFMVVLSCTLKWPTNHVVPGRLFILICSIAASKVILSCFSPFVGIICKWVIIGRYKPGYYPMWGPYHTRWWMVQKIVDICGIGIFGATNWTKCLYYRLMGAKIGKNVTINGARTGEWDLLEIKDGAILEHCLVRPFAGERNTTMYLAPITIGRNVVINKASIVAPGCSVPDNACMPPNSSAWELEDTDESFRDLPSNKVPGSPLVMTLFLTIPLAFISYILSLIPWALGLLGLVMAQPIPTDHPVRSVIHWFASGGRVGYHYLALVLRTMFSPFFVFAFAVLIRLFLDVWFGKMKPSAAANRSSVDKWRMALMKKLMPVSKLHKMTEIFGGHYEGTSVAVRLLGGKVGRRVYWPGTGPSIGDYHLIDIGNDVVFGSRSHLVTSDGISSEPVKIGDGAMIADRVCLLPGVEVGKSTVMGSGALSRRNKSYEDNSTWVGSRGGDAIHLARPRPKQTQTDPEKVVVYDNVDPKKLNLDTSFTDKANQKRVRVLVESANSSGVSSSASSTLASVPPMSPMTPTMITPKASSMHLQMGAAHNGILSNKSSRQVLISPTGTMTPTAPQAQEEELKLSPFGRAFYQGKAPYRVMGQFTIFLYSSFITAFTAALWNVPFILSIQIIYWLNYDSYLGQGFWSDALHTWGFMTACIAVITTSLAIIAILLVIIAKWTIIGHRKPGNYDWDKSSYCQRWQLFLNIEKVRRTCYRGNGILGMLTGTHWIVMYFRALGAQIGENCALFANGSPSLMFTEPDLLTMGDRCVVDDASLVGHINTRGTFDLNELHVGDRCVLRSGSRLLSGASMQNDSCLMEHTLVMGGDVVDERSTLQGWPAKVFKGDTAGHTNLS
ncbi:putative NRPS-like protein biosynthetic cluster [Pestalotiopsis sp. 9143b]|nr:putative NRPS-like protein biosynthetic cluster [Pestalotiopsis sp. 9143b]